MVLESDVKFLTRFDSDPIQEEVGSSSFDVVGDGEITLQGDGSGYKMSRDHYLLLLDVDLEVSSDMTIGFHLTPTRPGRIPDSPLSRELKISLFDFGIGSGFGSDFSMDETVFVAHEETQRDDTNRLRVMFYNSGSVTYQATTDSYDADKNHFFWIVYNGSNVDIYVDGSKTTLFDESGSVPSSLNASNVDFTINRLSLNDSDFVKSKAVINDLVVFNDYKDSKSTMKKWINGSVDDLVFEEQRNNENLYFGFMYDDPITDQTLDSYYDKTFVYSTTTDGKIKKGSQILWEVRHDFSNSDELSSLESFGGDASQSGGFVKLNGVTVRL